MMQARKAHHLLERILFVVIACTLVFAGLCIYSCLVGIYEDRWPPRVVASHPRAKGWSATSCVYHAQWTPIEPSLLTPGQPKAFQSRASFSLPAGGDSDLETFVLSSQDRHAPGIVHFDAQPTAAAAAASVIEVEVEAFYESEEALRTETRTVCALRRSQGRERGIGIGIFTAAAAAAPGHEHSARDDISFKIPVWLSRPRAGAQEVHVAFPAVAPPGQEEPGRPQSHERVIGDSPPPHAFDQASSMDPPTAPEPIAAGVTAQINNNVLPLNITLSTTDA